MKIKRKILTLILGVSLFIGCSSKEVSNENTEDVVAVINNHEITSDYFIKTISLQKGAVENFYGEEVWETEENGIKFKDRFKNDLMDQLITIYSIYSEAEEKNFLPTEDEVNSAVTEFNKTLESNENYKKDLEKSNIDETYIMYQQKQTLAIQNFEENFMENVEITDEEAKAYYDENKDEFEIENGHSDFEQVRDYIKHELKDDEYDDEIKKIKTEAEVRINQDVLENIIF